MCCLSEVLGRRLEAPDLFSAVRQRRQAQHIDVSARGGKAFSICARLVSDTDRDDIDLDIWIGDTNGLRGSCSRKVRSSASATGLHSDPSVLLTLGVSQLSQEDGKAALAVSDSRSSKAPTERAGAVHEAHGGAAGP